VIAFAGDRDDVEIMSQTATITCVLGLTIKPKIPRLSTLHNREDKGSLSKHMHVISFHFNADASSIQGRLASIIFPSSWSADAQSAYTLS
jgi:hypothetical protein